MMKRLSNIMFLLLLAILPMNFALSDDLLKKINIERNEEGLIDKIILVKSKNNLSSDVLLSNFLGEIKEMQKKIASANFSSASLDTTDWPEEYKEHANLALSQLKEHDLKEILENPKFIEAMQMVFESADLEIHNFRILAVPENSKYYLSNELVLKILRQASGLIRTAMGNSFGIDVAMFLITYSFDMIIERRNYYQNYMLYYFDKYGGEQYGLSDLEIAKIKSSVFESRIQWWKFWERVKAIKTWDTYGDHKHLDDLILSESRKNKRDEDLDAWGVPMGMIFHDGELKGKGRVVNLLDKRHLFSKKLSFAVDKESPKKIGIVRLVYFLMQIGMKFVPVPAVSSVFDFFMNSMYVQQRQTEGAVYGYYRDNDDLDMARIISFQSINPFVIAEEY
jgi:hypothetical protein